MLECKILQILFLIERVNFQFAFDVISDFQILFREIRMHRLLWLENEEQILLKKNGWNEVTFATKDRKFLLETNKSRNENIYFYTEE